MIAKQKILIVDDDENIAELISLYLMKECFDRKLCQTGRMRCLPLRHISQTLFFWI